MKRRIQEVARFTEKPAELASFYASVLDQDFDHSGSPVAFDVEGTTLFIHPSVEASPEPGWPANVDHIAIEVEDLERECERISGLGIEFMGPNDYPWGRAAYLTDPDGRLVELKGPGTDT